MDIFPDLRNAQRPAEGIRPRAAGERAVLVAIAASRALTKALEEGGQGVGSIRVCRWQQAASQPDVAQQEEEGDDECQDEEAALRPDPRPEDRVIAHAVVPDRIGPEVEQEAAQDEQEEDEQHDRCEPEPPEAESTPAPRNAPARWSPAGAWRRRLRSTIRISVVAGRAIVAARAVVAHFRPTPSLVLAAAQFLADLVEQVRHDGRLSLPGPRIPRRRRVMAA